MSAPTLEPTDPDFDVLYMLAAKLSAELDRAVANGHQPAVTLSGPEQNALAHVDRFGRP